MQPKLTQCCFQLHFFEHESGGEHNCTKRIWCRCFSTLSHQCLPLFRKTLMEQINQCQESNSTSIVLEGPESLLTTLGTWKGLLLSTVNHSPLAKVQLKSHVEGAGKVQSSPLTTGDFNLLFVLLKKFPGYRVGLNNEYLH